MRLSQGLKKLITATFFLTTLTSYVFSAPTQLIIRKVPVEINGKTADLYRIEQPDGTWGFSGTEGQIFDAEVKNETDSPTIIHWHGLLVPNSQDGVPYVTQPPIMSGKSYHYRFKLKQSGTYWMHSHLGLQVQQLLSAPFIIKASNEPTTDKDIVMFLSDFSFKSPESILAQLKKGTNLKPMTGNENNLTVTHKQMNMTMSPADKSQPDINDVNYDAFLTNYKTLQKPDIIFIKPGQTARLRIIAGAAMTNFVVKLGALQGKLIAVDGQNIKPIFNNQFQIAVGQRLDILIRIPPGQGSYPILAQGEGTAMQTGLILATEKAKIIFPPEKVKTSEKAFDYTQEVQLKSLKPLKKEVPGQILTVSLDGNMMQYIWQINNQAWPKVTPLTVKSNKRVEMIFINRTDMAHPMHLHGHFFEVTEIDGHVIKDGALHDTILVLPHSTVKVQFDTNNPGNWVMHCHMAYHQESGMMTFIHYEGTNIPDLSKAK
ncbi:multicopper oxidase family protein (plasmid) [Legionella sp. D16C41]|uniref:multicopper oxidase family protein n=1 Tax=Legionella sp. D16C41 TaxID=3402688 RepID=UPI003AF75F0E